MIKVSGCMRSFLGVIVFFMCWIAASATPNSESNTRKIMLERNTPVSLKLVQVVHSNDVTAKEGKIVDLEVRVDVVKEGEVLIATGAFAEGYIHSVNRERLFGKDATIEVRAKNVQTVDGQRAILFGGSLLGDASSKRKGLAWTLFLGLSILGGLIDIVRRKFGVALAGVVFGLLLGISTKGNPVELQMNESLTAYVAETMTIEIVDQP
jgi:hypothetical protein